MRNIYPSQFFLLTLISILWGIFLWNFTWDLILSGGILWLILALWGVVGQYYRQAYVFILVILLGLLSWVLFSIYSLLHIQENTQVVDRYEGMYSSYIWEIQGLSQRKEFYDEYIVKLKKIDNENIDWRIHHLLRIPKNFTLAPHQVITYEWKVYRFENFNGFSYENYMLSRDIYFSTSTSTVKTLSEDTGSLRYKLYSSRERLLTRIENIFPKREAIFLWGILLWAREDIPKELKEDFNNSWLTHFIAVSGFNITLCVIFTTFLFGFLPIWGRIIAVSSVIIWFSFFVWLGAPVVRAAIMWILWYIFLQSGNQIRNIILMSFTAVCMVMFAPLSLTYDTSLHLSFLAVIGIMYTQDIFKKMFFFIPEVFAIKEAFVLTLSALSFALPIMIFGFGQISILAPFANIAVAWTIPIAMLLWAITLIIDMVSTTLWQLLGFITWILLYYDMKMVEFFGNLEFALVHFDFWVYKNYLLILYFLLLSYGVFHYGKIKKK